MRKVYTKNLSGRYKEMGYEWAGFPANGIWLVKDGSSNCLIKLSDITEPMPPKTLDYLLLAEQFITEMNPLPRSIADTAKEFALYLAKKAIS